MANKMIAKLAFIFLIVIITVNAEYVSYNNYKVYKITPTTDEEVNVLTKLKDQNEHMFWLDYVKKDRDVKIMVDPGKQETFERFLATRNIKGQLVIEDVQRLIDEQRKRPATARSSDDPLSYKWDYYHSWEEIEVWMEKIAEKYSDVASIVTAGRSVEGRDIRGIKIDFKKRERPVMGMIESTLHAREWITPVTATWIINEFLTSTDPDVRFLAENVEWHIFPVTNPDGYVYSFTDNRMWRKNRSKASFTNCSVWNLDDDMSNGVDLNRNFGFLWMQIGASQDPCMETYAGPVAFSEPEAMAIANYVTGLQQRGNLVYYFAFHSYSQMILVPYSHVGGADVLSVPNYADMFEIAVKGTEKLKQRYNTSYQVGTSLDILYPVTGSAFDWVKGGAGVPIVLLYELRDVGEYGFLLPTEQIIPNNKEVMDSLVEIDKTTRALGYYHSGTSIVSISGILLVIAVLSNKLLY